MLNFQMMGVINITPNSFSDASDPLNPQIFADILKTFSKAPILDLGAESTAPMNSSISYEEELARFEPYLDQIFASDKIISIDTYHPETIFFFQNEWKKRSLKNPLVWNDVSGKWDESVERFLKASGPYSYVFAHNLATTREQSGRHMEFTQRELSGTELMNHLEQYFKPYCRENVVLDPCFGFSKTYEQNWFALEHLGELQKKLQHNRWLVGISRKSFLRQKYQLTSKLEDREQLDQIHLEEIKRMSREWVGEIWLRTHRPELTL